LWSALVHKTESSVRLRGQAPETASMKPTILSFCRRCSLPWLTAVVLLVGCQGSKKPVANSTGSSTGSVTALGRLEPYNGIIQLSSAPGDRVIKWLVEEGGSCPEGTELVVLDSKELRRVEKNLAEIQLKEAVARLAAVEISRKAQLDDAAIKRKRTEDSLEYDVQLVEKKVKLLAEQLRAAEDALATLRSLGMGAVPDQDLKRQALAVESAEVELASAVIMRKKAIEARANAGLEGDAQLAALKANLDRARLEIPSEETARINADLANKRYEASLIKAPTEGVVFSILTRPGEAVGPRPFIRMGDTRTLAVIAEVDETQALRVKRGSKALVTNSKVFRDLNIEPLVGRVEYIAPAVSRSGVSDLNPAALSDRRVVDVKIQLKFKDAAGEEIRKRVARLINLQVDVEILPEAYEP
jgi:ABC exporter DevB family membrane fusion protein